MGDKILKTIFILALFVFGVFAKETNNELVWVDEQVKEIKKNRKGVPNKKIVTLKDPFIFLEKNKTKNGKTKKQKKVYKSTYTTTKTSSYSNYRRKTYKKRRVYTSKKFKLKAIINNSALINGRWYKIGDKIGGYTVEKITLKEVTLKRGKRVLILTTYKKYR